MATVKIQSDGTCRLSRQGGVGMRWRRVCLHMLCIGAACFCVVLLSWVFHGVPHTSVRVAAWLTCNKHTPLFAFLGLMSGFAGGRVASWMESREPRSGRA